MLDEAPDTGSTAMAQAATADPTAPAPGLRFATFSDHNAAVGLAARFLMAEPGFARLPFGQLAAVLDGQAMRGHYGFVLDAAGQVRGFLGWALATRAGAETFAQGGQLTSDECRSGECLVINAWVEKDPAVHGFLVGKVRALGAGKTAVYARRLYPDGRVRTMRLAVDSGISSRVAPRPAATPNPTP